MRIWDSCAHSEDIKHQSGAVDIFFYYQMGYGPYLIDKKGREFGHIDMVDGMYLGDDIIIKKIVIYNNEELSKKLTDEFKSKILIWSKYRDSIS